MTLSEHVKVAVLLATYNGARYIEPQIESLKENATTFTLHWLDDHSTDSTREVLRAAALKAGIDLCEWHQPDHQGIPGAFFKLIECVDADIYFFCDQDDIWQPGKIDATVANLMPDLRAPVLCFSDPFVFDGDDPESCRRLTDVLGIRIAVALQESRMFMYTPTCGHTMGFTRPLRELYLQHKDVARGHALQHDCWMYLIAHASGTPRILRDAPTTLYRRHANNLTVSVYQAIVSRANRIVPMWQQQRLYRPAFARQAHGFIVASPTLPASPKLNRLLELARLVAGLKKRQSPAALIRLARRRVMFPVTDFMVLLLIACLCTDARV